MEPTLRRKGDDISERLLEFAVRVTRLVAALPKNPIGKHIGLQLMRSGTSAGANYEEARGAESKADFVHKLGISWKEIREACYWLRIIVRAEIIKANRMKELITEGMELVAILGGSLKTAKRRS